MTGILIRRGKHTRSQRHGRKKVVEAEIRVNAAANPGRSRIASNPQLLGMRQGRILLWREERRLGQHLDFEPLVSKTMRE